jgi:NO-binding membrane sensor protein with MHYT domain/nitrogen-specific signal transduction histidine kinase
MLRILYTCITGQHDFRLVGIAATVCLFACYTTVNLFVHARESARGRGPLWLSVASVVFGAGVWATHFIAELAYKPGLPLDYDFGLTVLSLVIAVVVTFVGMAMALRYRHAWVGGTVIGAAVGAMHYVGMAALRAPADIHWTPALVLLSLVIGATLTAAAFRIVSGGSGLAARIGATVLLVGGICGLHFTGMAAVWLEPDPFVAVPQQVADPELLAIAVAAVTALIIGLGLSSAIAEDRRARQTLAEIDRIRASAAHLDLAQRVVGVGSLQVNLRTGQVKWSNEFYRIQGLDTDTPPRLENVRRNVHRDDVVAWDAHVAEMKGGGRCQPFEFRYIRPDGRYVLLCEESDVTLDDDNIPIQQITTIRDITQQRAAELQRKELERQLQHSQKLEALGILAGGIAHDLNNTLMPILALSRMCLGELPENSPMRDDIETIAVASERARDLVQRILAFSRKQDLDWRRIDLAAVTRDALRMMRASLPATIQIDDMVAEVPPLAGDAGQLQQVIVNLMTNAAQAIGDRAGRIAVTLSQTTSGRLGSAGAGVCLTVADTGCGMDEATLDRVFDPFYTTKAVGDGSGLGLAVAHGIVNSHHGKIEITSTPGQGTEFRIILPCRGTDQERSSPAFAEVP